MEVRVMALPKGVLAFSAYTISRMTAVYSVA